MAPGSDFTNSKPPSAPVSECSFGPAMGMGHMKDIGVDVKDNGRIDIDCDKRLVEAVARLSQISFQRHASPPPAYTEVEMTATTEPVTVNVDDTPVKRPWQVQLNIVIQVVGSRGDVQPFIALGNELRRSGHRVRPATHDEFAQFVRGSGLEFYPIGGDPSELMAYMVRNPGLIPSIESLRRGEIQSKCLMIREMLDGCWQACIQPDPLTHKPFVADAIIANPPSLAHVHCAQALCIPVHLMFTMPWTSTAAFPHPLANLCNSSNEQMLMNYTSYTIVNWLIWQGVGGVINDWRTRLDLEKIATFEGPQLAEMLDIPFTYCWSPALVPKPTDWPSYVDICGFFFRDSPKYDPPAELLAFIAAGPPPVYIGFGSIVLDNPDHMTATVLQAVKAAGVRAIISKGWSKLSGTADSDVYFIGDCPHEWLFQHVSVVVHHGGAGTTACGLRNGKPTLIIPFFGDQPFWGNMVAAAGAGPTPIPHKLLTVDNLVDSIRFCLLDEVQRAASKISDRLQHENGTKAAVKSFHRHLPLERLRCDILPNKPAVWSFSTGKKIVKLSKQAAELLMSKSCLEPEKLRIQELNAIDPHNRRWDPVTGGSSAVLRTTADLTEDILGTFYKPYTAYCEYKWEKQCEHRSTITGTSHDTTASCLEDPENVSDEGTTYAISSRTSSRSFSGMKLAGRMAGASAKSLGSFVPDALKGMTVDIPLAMTDGMRNAPRLYGEKVYDYGRVTDIKSGFTVAGKNFAWGMAEGLTDIVTKPYQGAKAEGAKGAIFGIGKGLGNFGAKTGAAMLGTLVYPGAGLAQSLRTLAHSKTRKRIADARHREGRWLVEEAAGDSECVDVDEVVAAFERLIETQK